MRLAQNSRQRCQPICVQKCDMCREFVTHEQGRAHRQDREGRKDFESSNIEFGHVAKKNLLIQVLERIEQSKLHLD
jgi:hypothetical protein